MSSELLTRILVLALLGGAFVSFLQASLRYGHTADLKPSSLFAIPPFRQKHRAVQAKAENLTQMLVVRVRRRALAWGVLNAGLTSALLSAPVCECGSHMPLRFMSTARFFGIRPLVGSLQAPDLWKPRT